jgi:hypothetical protein
MVPFHYGVLCVSVSIPSLLDLSDRWRPQSNLLQVYEAFCFNSSRQKAVHSELLSITLFW